MARAVTSFGYGRMTAGRGVNLKAHRVSWAIHHGPISDSAAVLHRCDNPRCCNPFHLFIGTKRDNTRDMMAKGRMKPPPIRRGAAHHLTKFDETVVRDIIADKRSARLVADELGVSAKTIHRIRQRKSWRHALAD